MTWIIIIVIEFAVNIHLFVKADAWIAPQKLDQNCWGQFYFKTVLLFFTQNENQKYHSTELPTVNGYTYERTSFAETTSTINLYLPVFSATHDVAFKGWLDKGNNPKGV